MKTKKFNEKLMPKGSLKIFNNKTNELLVDKNNLIITTGKTFVRDKLSGSDTTNYIKSFAFGTGTTVPVVGDTGLEIPVLYDVTNTYKTFEEYTEDSATKVTFIGFYSSLQPYTQPVDVTEVGLFTGSLTTAGTMYCRATFDAITKDKTIELRLEYSQEF